MKILFLTKYYPPVEGGIERYGHMLCSELSKRGIEVEVVAASETGGTSRVEHVDGVKVHRLGPQINFSSTAMTLELPRLLRQIAGNFDILHLNFPNPWTDMLYLSLCRKQKAVVTYHSDIYRRADSFSGVLLRMYHPVIHRMLARVSAIITSSPDIIDHSPFLISQRSRCRVIPMPVDMSTFASVDDQNIEEEAQRFGKFVLFVGRFVYYKGLHVLIDAISRLDEVNLVLVGRGPLEEELKQQAREFGVEDRVFFVGKIPDERLKVLYHACMCFALPSVTHAEGFGIVLAEAMSCGKPVISTDLQTGTTYVNKEGVTGYVVAPNDANMLAEKIALLSNDEDKAQAMGAAAKKRVAENFDKPIVVEKTIQVYEEVLAGQPISS